MRLKKPKRSDFEKGHFGKQDLGQALQVWALSKELMARGMTVEELREFLKREDGGFGHWDFMFEEK